MHESKLGPVLVAAATLGVSFAAFRAWGLDDRANTLARTGDEARRASLGIAAGLESRMRSLKQLARSWELSPPDNAHKRVEAELVLADLDGLRAIEWLDPSFHVGGVVPQDQPADADLAAEMAATPARRAALARGAATMTPSFSRPGGGRAFLALVPIAGGGLLVGVFDTRTLFDSLLREQIARRFPVAIFEDGVEIYRSGPTRSELASPGEATVSLEGNAWRVRLGAPPWTSSRYVSVRNVFLPAAVLFSMLVAAITYLAQDARRQTKAETASEGRYRSLLAHIPDVAWTADAEGRRIFVSPNAERVYGFTPEEIYAGGTGVWPGRMHPEDRERVSEAYRLLCAERIPYDQEYRFQRKDGAWIWLRDRALEVHRDAAGPCADGMSSDITERKATEWELWRTRNQLEEAQAIAQMGSWDWDVASDVVTWSAELCRIYGVAAGFRGRYQDFLDRVHPEDRARVDGCVRAAYAAGSDFVYDERIVRSDGAARTLHGRGQAVAEAGRTVRMFGICQDVTERVATEAALRESEQRFRSIFENGPLGMVYSRFERERRQTKPNRKFCEMLGYTAEELNRMTVRDITHPDDIAGDLALWERLGSGEISSYHLEKRYLRKDGTAFWGSLTTCLIGSEGDEGRHALVLVEDINERKQSDGRFHGLIESAPDAMVIADREGRIVIVNAQTEALFGYGRDELLGQPVEVLVPSRLGEKHSEHRQRFLAEPRFRAMGAGMELYGRRKDGSEFPVEISLSPLQTEAGTLVSSAIRDITERKRADEKLRVVTQRLRALSDHLLELQEAERRHLARELHDQMGQTLMAIKLSLEAGLHFPDSPGLQKHVGDAVSLLDRLLSDVRSLSLQLRPALLEELGLDAAIRSLLEQQVGRAGMAFGFVPLGAPGRLDGKLESACYRVAQEAVSNAIRHARAKSLQVALRLEAEQLHLVVSDDGTGFDPEEAQGRPADSRGFGLLSMEERVRLIGGQLTIRSREGGGAIVHAVFPVGPKPRKGSSGAPSP